MVQEFNQDATNASRSLQIYLILIGAAARRETMTYSMLSERIYGSASQRHTLGPKLGPLMNWCKANELPALTALVVNEESGKPSTGLTTVDGAFGAEQEQIFSYNWYGIFPPAIEELKSL